MVATTSPPPISTMRAEKKNKKIKNIQKKKTPSVQKSVKKSVKKAAVAKKKVVAKKKKAVVVAKVVASKGGGDAVSIDRWDVLGCGGSTKGSSVGAIATRMMQNLEPFFARVKELGGEVVIELQPPVALQQFHYLMHEIHGMALGFGIPVRFQQAKRKERAVPNGATSRSTNYETRKAGAIEDCKTWLAGKAGRDKWLQWFLSNFKKDDAADALLHAAVALPKRRGAAVMGIDVGITHLGACILVRR